MPPRLHPAQSMQMVQDTIRTYTPNSQGSAFAMLQDQEACLSASANKYFAKPVKLKALHVTIQRLLT